MKAIAFFLTTFFLAANGCEDMKDTVIEYSAMSRGFYLTVVVKDENVTVTQQRKGEPKTTKLSQDDLKAIADMVKEIDLEGVPDLKAPTEKRFYDGAAIANLKITRNGEVYETQGFDHGDPPAAVKKLVDKLMTFVPEEKDED
jgi:hypothetical protein